MCSVYLLLFLCSDFVIFVRRFGVFGRLRTSMPGSHARRAGLCSGGVRSADALSRGEFRDLKRAYGGQFRYL